MDLSSEGEESSTNTPSSLDQIHQPQQKDGSILFQPHRTVGIISSSQPFSLSKNKSNSHMDTFMTMPLQERFVIYKCDSLKPVLVSDQLPGTTKNQTKNNNFVTATSKGKMFHAISDASLGITVTTHAYPRWSASHTTLYKRTKCVDTRKNVQGSNWGLIQVLNLGRSKFPVSISGNKLLNEENGDSTQKMEKCCWP